MNRPKEHKPEAILAAAVDVFLRDGVGASTAKVAEAAGVSNGTLFNYFPTKQDLIDQLYVSIKKDMVAAVGSTEREDPLEDRFRTIWTRWFGWARSNRGRHEVMNLLHRSGMASEEAQDEANRLFTSVSELLTEATEANLFVNLPMSYVSSVVQIQLDQAIAHQLSDQQAAVAFDSLWQGITDSN